MAVARFQNGAEAGYFADELSRLSEFDVEVLARERFDAVHAVWSVDYILMAPPSDAPQVAQALRELVDSSDDHTDSEETNERRGSDLPGGVWMPLILTLAAGSIACWGVERADQRLRPPALVDRDPRVPPDLWQVLSVTPGAWRQHSADGRGGRELTVDSQTQTAVLREDHDGDGIFERECRFDWRKKAATRRLPD